MKIIFCCLIIATILSCTQNNSVTNEETTSVNFDTSSFAEIKTKAKAEGKLIFMDVATSWCGPCNWLSQYIFTNDTVAEYFNSKFINVKFDAEKGEGIEIAREYNVRCYPNLLFIDVDGNIVHRVGGALDVKELIQFAEDAQNPEINFRYYANNFEEKKSDTEFITKYIEVLKQSCLPFDSILEEYFKTQKNEQLAGRTNWSMINEYSSKYDSYEFLYLLNNMELFYDLYTPDTVNKKIKNVLVRKCLYVNNSRDTVNEGYYSFRKKISEINFPVKDEILFRLDLIHFSSINDWNKYIRLAIEKGGKYYHDKEEIDIISWNIYDHSEGIITKDEIMEWMNNEVNGKQQFQWDAWNIYAKMLYKAERKAEARKAINKAIELSLNSDINKDELSQLRYLAYKIEKMK